MDASAILERHDGLKWATLGRMQRYLLANLIVWLPIWLAVVLTEFGIDDADYWWIQWIQGSCMSAEGVVLGLVYCINWLEVSSGQ